MLPRRASSAGRRLRAASSSPLSSAASSAVELGRERLLILGLEARAQVARRGPVHAGDLHVAAERDRADPVLDAAAARLHERGREADVELPRPHPDRARGEEVAGLVDQDQDGEPEDRDRDAHPTEHQVPARASASTSSARSRAGAPSTAPRTSSTAAAMSRKPIRPLEERLDGDLVRGVVGARVGAAALAGLAGEREHAEGIGVGLVELERAQLERRHGRRGALGVGRARRRSGRACRGCRGARSRRRRGSGRARGRSTADGSRPRSGRRGRRRGSAPRSPRGPCWRAWPSRS